MKGIVAILALVRVLQTAFTFPQLQGLNGTTPPNHFSPEYKALATKMNRLSTEVAALKTRVSALKKMAAASALSSTGDSTVSIPFVIQAEPIPIAKNIPSVAPTNTPIPSLNSPTPAAPPSPCHVLDVQLAPEHRCSPYNSDDYSYPQVLESQTVNWMERRIYIPDTGRNFASTSEIDIEHFVARVEAHDCGLHTPQRCCQIHFTRDLPLIFSFQKQSTETILRLFA